MKSCTQCQAEFEITDSDRAFYDKLGPVFNGKKYLIPEPTLCPECRLQRRLIWRAELNLFTRKSDLSGKQMLSFYPPNADCIVYSPEEWLSDDWDPLEYGRDFDFSRPFFEQFAELVREVPLQALSLHSNENSDYINNASWNKNCYLLAGANFNEDCYYGNYVDHNKSCIDNNFVNKSELCYDCVNCRECFNLKYSFNCRNCSDSAFLYNSQSSRHCFGSSNLVEKEYVFYNEQLGKEEYERRLQGLELDQHNRVQRAKEHFEQHRLKYPYKYMLGEMNENVSGYGINTSRDCHYCFDISDCWDCKYCTWLHQSKNCMDIMAWGYPDEECYECLEVGDNSQRVLFCATIYHGSNMLYSYFCVHGCEDLFGCVGLKRKKYCIFNKQYSREEYEVLVSKILDHMQKTGEYGEFFPMLLCPMSYNQTVVQDYFPLSKKQALNLRAKWNDQDFHTYPETKFEIPDSIHDVDQSICDQILICEKSGKAYKIIPQEYRFLKKHGIPIPRLCFEERHKARLARRTQRRLWDRECAKCGKELKTSYSPKRPEKVYCESCYRAEMY
jgi:hypothetical protein